MGGGEWGGTSDDGHLVLQGAPEFGWRDEWIDVGAEAGDELCWGRWFGHFSSVGLESGVAGESRRKMRKFEMPMLTGGRHTGPNGGGSLHTTGAGYCQHVPGMHPG